MSILARIGVRSTLLSMVEVVFFFGVLTVAYFVGVSTLYVAVTDAGDEPISRLFTSSYPFADLGELLFLVPVWMWFVQVAGYLLLVTIYWAPGDEGINRTEMRALVLTMLLACLAAGIRFHRTVAQLAQTFWKIVTG